MVHLSIIGCAKLSLEVRGSQEAGFTQLHGDKFTLLITLRFKIFCPNLPVLVLPSISHRLKRPLHRRRRRCIEEWTHKRRARRSNGDRSSLRENFNGVPAERVMGSPFSLSAALYERGV